MLLLSSNVLASSTSTPILGAAGAGGAGWCPWPLGASGAASKTVVTVVALERSQTTPLPAFASGA